ncbi:unnamed protein product [Rhizophagus irregularis]|nr:unnamed protein product [Rhizophagus irregularis]
MSFNNETQVVSEFNISDEDSSSGKNYHDNCYDPDNGKFWCKECVPRCIIEGGLAVEMMILIILSRIRFITQEKVFLLSNIHYFLNGLNGSQNMSADYLNELKTHWKLNCKQSGS